jgi:O-antigen/teichoic acid export membrane protein
MAWIALAPLNRTFVPRFVSVQKHDAQLTQPLLNMTFGLSLLASLPFAVLFFMGGGLLEKWFFVDYNGLASVLIIMGIGQVFNCLTGPVIWMVQLTGNEKLWRWVLLASNLASALGVWLSVTVFGMDLLGASILYTLALIIPNTAAFLICVRRLKLNYGLQFKNLLTDLKKYG